MLNFDPGRVADVVRKGDPEALKRHYRTVFGTDSGAIVLLDILVRAKVAQGRPAEMSTRAAGFHDGRADLALEILALAGPDPTGAALGIMITELEGDDSDRHERQYDDGNDDHRHHGNGDHDEPDF